MVPTPASRDARRQRGRGDEGDGLIGSLLAIALFFLLLVGAVEFMVDGIGRAALQHTLAQAARAGAVQGGGKAACQEKAAQSGLLGGSMAKDVTIDCTETADRIVATARGQFKPWLRSSWPWRINLTATAARQDQ